jgi:hypothetical protein
MDQERRLVTGRLFEADGSIHTGGERSAPVAHVVDGFFE